MAWTKSGTIKGPKGDTGNTGATGATGATGPTGAAGTPADPAVLAAKVKNYDTQDNTLFVGTQAAYDALSSGVKNAAGFVAVIRG